jgi:hypothetical protein
MQLDQADKALIIEFLGEQSQTDNLVSLQGEDIYDEQPAVYGLYGNTSDFVSNYLQSGGLWNYESPKKLLQEIKSVKEVVLNSYSISLLNPSSRESILASLREYSEDESVRYVSIRGYKLYGEYFFSEILTTQDKEGFSLEEGYLSPKVHLRWIRH